MQTVLEQVPDEKDIILQIDIEGEEWAVFDSLEESEMNRFSQIIGEFHHLTSPGRLDKIFSVFDKMLKTHVPIHLHYNDGTPPIGCRDFLIGGCFEISFARMDLGPFLHSWDVYPTSLDRPNSGKGSDIYIGQFVGFGDGSQPECSPPLN